MRYASGKYALAICDRCGQRGAYLDMVTEPETNLRVHADCMDQPIRYRNREPDAIALRHPRPDVTFDVPDPPEDRF